MTSFYAHCDWITTTWRGEAVVAEWGTVSALADWYRAMFGKEEPDCRLERWAWQGYIGWSIGGLSIGERVDGSILRASGRVAQAYLEAGYPIGHNVSRLDLCIDLWNEYPPDTNITLHNVETLDYRFSHPKNRYNVACVNGYGDGDTLMIGSRESPVYIRIYNKEAQSNGEERYKGCTRYEVEYKGEVAKEILHRGGIRRGGASGIADEVVGLLHRRGVDISGYVSSNGHSARPAPRISTTDERKLEWLRTQVQPTVKGLLTRHDVGLILRALGLDET